MAKDLRSVMIAGGVHDLRKFGYPGCTAENITSDLIYSSFFDSQLEEGRRQITAPRTIEAIDALRAEIAANRKKAG